MSQVRCRICGEILERRHAVRSDVRAVPGGEHWGWAHPDCENVALALPRTDQTKEAS